MTFGPFFGPLFRPKKVYGIATQLSSTVAIAESITDVLYYNDPNAIPLTDYERAADMPYDTDIGEV